MIVFLCYGLVLVRNYFHLASNFRASFYFVFKEFLNFFKILFSLTF